MPIFDPVNFKSVPHGDQDAWLDLAGTLALMLNTFDIAIRALGGAPYPILPLGTFSRGTTLGAVEEPDPDKRRLMEIYPDDDWLGALQARLDGQATALLIAAPSDLRSYDLTDPDQFASWTTLLSAELVRKRQAIGI